MLSLNKSLLCWLALSVAVVLTFFCIESCNQQWMQCLAENRISDAIMDGNPTVMFACDRTRMECRDGCE